MRVDGDHLKEMSKKMAAGLPTILSAGDLDELRGQEGLLSTVYFSVFDELILNQKDHFMFHGRNRRPPTDRVNALLSFVYTILANDCASAL